MIIFNTNVTFVLAAVFTFVFTLSGCTRTSKYVYVESSLIDTTKNETQAEVTMTPHYSKIFPRIKSVALNAPSSCANQSTSTATGQAEGKGSIVKTYCGVEMAEIEKALVRQGFTVYSWNMMQNALKINQTPIEVAKSLGAQVLFQVNSLERVKVKPGRDTRIEHNFFGSNDKGEKLNSLELEQYWITEVNKLIETEEHKQLSSAKKLGAMLDISAVDAETGQTIWFYRWFNNEDTSKSLFATYFLQCWSNWGCRNEREQGQASTRATLPEKRSAEVETFQDSARPASEEDATYFTLLRNVTADFGKRFSSGK